MGIAQTGTGKTAAFSLPLLQNLLPRFQPLPGKPRALILAPTRELAAQIGSAIKDYGKHLRFTHTVIFGGVGQHQQVQALRKGVDILVATPGRLLDLMGQGHVHLDRVEIFVLDEADRMLDMGFIHDVRRVIKELPRKKQSLFFSATMSRQVSQLAKTLLHNPVRVEVTPQATTVERIEQRVLYVDTKDKNDLLLELLDSEHLDKVLVFTRTKHRANKLAQLLSKHGIRSSAIHGNKSQTARTNALKGFREGRIRVLVATDIAARGIDVEDISHVINYEIPNEPETYVHRIGRTARAGAEGTAYSLCAAEERDQLRQIEKLIGQEVPSLQHKRHSQKAMDARGAAAKPKQRQHRGNPKARYSRRRR